MSNEATDAPKPLTLEQINAAINEQRDALMREIKSEQALADMLTAAFTGSTAVMETPHE